MTEKIPQIVRVNGRPRLLVDGKPFLILGLQWDCDSCFSPQEMNPLFPHAARMGANTAVLPTYWREVEPEPDQFDFRMVDERIQQARANGLRLILLWFATWKNGSAFYAPDYIRHNPDTYPPAVDRDGQALVTLCPLGEATWERDRQALVMLMQHLRDADVERTVIMLQIENEAGLVGSDRCYCPVCNEKFDAGEWIARFGPDAAEAFSVVSIASYIDRLAAEAKAVYPLPLYTNVALGLSTPYAISNVPGRDYFSGGAVPHMLDLFRRQVQRLDLIAPDPYMHSYREFQEISQIYSADGNPYYVAEHSSSPTGRAERNVFYAVGQYGAIGFDPWAIDSPFPEREVPPLVDPIGGEWGPQAYWLRDSYVAIGRAIKPIVEAQGTERLFTFVQEAGEYFAGWKADGCDILISYLDRDGAGRGMIIQQTANEFLVVGVGFGVYFRRPRPDGRPVPVRSAEWGYYDADHWVVRHPMRREQLESVGRPLQLLEPGVALVVLDLG